MRQIPPVTNEHAPRERTAITRGVILVDQDHLDFGSPRLPHVGCEGLTFVGDEGVLVEVEQHCEGTRWMSVLDVSDVLQPAVGTMTCAEGTGGRWREAKSLL